jgi:hypothetical protein
MIPNARIGYPKLFKPEAIKGMAESRPRYGCQIYLPKTDESTRAKINQIIRDIVKDQLKGVMPQQKDLCYKDGDEDGDENTAGNVILSANRQESQGRPTVIDRDRAPLTQEDARIYAGCRCNFLVGFFVPKGWKKIACGLEIVQFRGDDEPFGAGRPPVDVMPEMADEEEGGDENFAL